MMKTALPSQSSRLPQSESKLQSQLNIQNTSNRNAISNNKLSEVQLQNSYQHSTLKSAAAPVNQQTQSFRQGWLATNSRIQQNQAQQMHLARKISKSKMADYESAGNLASGSALAPPPSTIMTNHQQVVHSPHEKKPMRASSNLARVHPSNLSSNRQIVGSPGEPSKRRNETGAAASSSSGIQNTSLRESRLGQVTKQIATMVSSERFSEILMKTSGTTDNRGGVNLTATAGARVSEKQAHVVSQTLVGDRPILSSGYAASAERALQSRGPEISNYVRGRARSTVRAANMPGGAPNTAACIIQSNANSVESVLERGGMKGTGSSAATNQRNQDMLNLAIELLKGGGPGLGGTQRRRIKEETHTSHSSFQKTAASLGVAAKAQSPLLGQGLLEQDQKEFIKVCNGDASTTPPQSRPIPNVYTEQQAKAAHWQSPYGADNSAERNFSPDQGPTERSAGPIGQVRTLPSRIKRNSQKSQLSLNKQTDDRYGIADAGLPLSSQRKQVMSECARAAGISQQATRRDMHAQSKSMLNRKVGIAVDESSVNNTLVTIQDGARLNEDDRVSNVEKGTAGRLRFDADTSTMLQQKQKTVLSTSQKHPKGMHLFQVSPTNNSIANKPLENQLQQVSAERDSAQAYAPGPSGNKLLTKISRVNGSVPTRVENGYWKSPQDGLFHVAAPNRPVKPQHAGQSKNGEYRVPTGGGTFGSKIAARALGDANRPGINDLLLSNPFDRQFSSNVTNMAANKNFQGGAVLHSLPGNADLFKNIKSPYEFTSGYRPAQPLGPAPSNLIGYNKMKAPGAQPGIYPPANTTGVSRALITGKLDLFEDMNKQPAPVRPPKQAFKLKYSPGPASPTSVEKPQMNPMPKEPPKQQQFSPDEFDIEYAKLIAKQFPIHDDNGKVIDYSNINEFQLELLALHEEYGEETDPIERKRIFNRLMSMREEEFYRHRSRKGKKMGEKGSSEPSTSAGTDGTAANKNLSAAKKQPNFSRKGYGVGNTVGKDAGNPEYRKNVIQLEKERIQRERHELSMKRKRNSNYIQHCIKSAAEHYDRERLQSLVWLRKDHNGTGLEDREDPNESALHQRLMSKLDEKNLEVLRRKQEIIAKYNKMSKENKPSVADDGYYRYSLVRGNNCRLVKRVLEAREHWLELEQQHLTLYSFKWTPVSRFINFEQLGAHGQKKLVNHLQCHDLISTKDQLYTNMHRFCEQSRLNVFQYLPVQFVLEITAKNFTHEIDRFCAYFNTIERVRKKPGDGGRQGQLKQINRLIENSKNINAESKYKNIVSRKFTLDSEMYDGANVWLIKPNDFNRGRGVRLFNNLGQLRKLIKEFATGNELDFYVHNACCQILANEKHHSNVQDITRKLNSEGPAAQLGDEGNSAQTPNQAPPVLSANVRSEVFVIQKYIERPLLIDNRKFDIRLWVLINQTDLANQRCYLFTEGYIRTSSQKFTLSEQSIEAPFVHLTNNAVQQLDAVNYGNLEEGNQLSFDRASEMLKQAGRNVDFFALLNGQIKDIILMSLKSVDGGKLNPQGKRHCFEIFGYDFMIDEKLQPWLIEVNTNPCLEETSALLRQLLPRMLDDAFRLTLDVQFPPPRVLSPAERKRPTGPQVLSDARYDAKSWSPNISPFKVDGYDDSTNLWNHIYTLKQA